MRNVFKLFFSFTIINKEKFKEEIEVYILSLSFCLAIKSFFIFTIF